MSNPDRWRRALVVALVAAFLLVPGAAWARFSATAAPTMTVGTATLAAPTGVTGEFRCSSGLVTERMEVTVDGLVDDTARPATKYTYELTARGTTKVVGPVSSRGVSIAALIVHDISATTWTLTVRSSIGSWTSPAATVTMRCALAGFNSGTF